jgi:hypothetical protein
LPQVCTITPPDSQAIRIGPDLVCLAGCRVPGTGVPGAGYGGAGCRVRGAGAGWGA